MKKLLVVGVAFGLMLSACSDNNMKLENKSRGKGSGNTAAAAGSLIPVTNKHAARAAHTATLLTNGSVLISLLDNGEVLITGGYDESIRAIGTASLFVPHE